MSRIEKLNEFLQKNPDDNFVQHALALEYIKIGRDREARNLFEKILDRDPGYIGSYYHLGKLLEQLGEKDLAIQWYVKGMNAAKAAVDSHAYSELLGAFEDLTE